MQDKIIILLYPLFYILAMYIPSYIIILLMISGRFIPGNLNEYKKLNVFVQKCTKTY